MTIKISLVWIFGFGATHNDYDYVKQGLHGKDILYLWFRRVSKDTLK